MKGASTLDKIQIENVRSLKDTGLVPLSPITLLVGTNSSGKSTFLRTFPLIKQSICKRTDGPLLWAGDVDDYVDFGSFSETITNDGVSNTIIFRFEFSFDYNLRSQYRYYIRGDRNRLSNSLSKDKRVVYSISVSHKGTQEYVSELDVILGNDQYIFRMNPKLNRFETVVNDISIKKVGNSKGKKDNDYSFTRNWRSSSLGSIFGFHLPSITPHISEICDKICQVKFPIIESKDQDEVEYYNRRYSMLLHDAMEIIGQSLCKGDNLDDTHNHFSQKKKEDDELSAVVVDVLDVISSLETENKIYYLNVFKLVYFYTCFPALDSYIDTYFRQVHYIAPLRATAERYYRLRNLAIDEVDYQGKNLSIFLNGLTKARRTSFQQWTEQYFGFRVETASDSGHLSVRIALQNSSKSVNLSDTGFGYSQILPIITQLWDLSSREAKTGSSSRLAGSNTERIPLVIAIEQPELHLHPALQAKLAKAFIASIHLAKENGYQLQIILETHSETIVNYFGRAISRNELSEKDISVLVFNKETESNQTRVQICNYDKDGYMSSNLWPIGFFAPED